MEVIRRLRSVVSGLWCLWSLVGTRSQVFGPNRTGLERGIEGCQAPGVASTSIPPTARSPSARRIRVGSRVCESTFRPCCRLPCSRWRPPRWRRPRHRRPAVSARCSRTTGSSGWVSTRNRQRPSAIRDTTRGGPTIRPRAIEARNDYLRRTMPRLDGIERGRLDAGDQLNYDLYRDMIATAVEGLEFANDAMPLRGVIPHNLRMPINQMEGIQQDIPRLISLMPAATRRRLREHRRAPPGGAGAGRSDDRADEAGAGAGHDAAADHASRRARAGRGADRRRPADQPAARGVREDAGRRSRRRIAIASRRPPSRRTRMACGRPSHGSTSFSSRPTCPAAARRPARMRSRRARRCTPTTCAGTRRRRRRRRRFTRSAWRR